MTRAPGPHPDGVQAASQDLSDNVSPPMVASLGVRVRLVPADRDQERQLDDLIASFRILSAEWELLFQQVINTLSEGAPVREGKRPSPPSRDQ